MAWIGVDFDGTLATHVHGQGEAVGEPIMPMVNRVKRWLSEGKDVQIVTARASLLTASLEEVLRNREAIQKFCWQHFGRDLPIRTTKDYGMVELWDDRAVQLIPNTGVRAVDAANAQFDIPF